MQTTMLFEDGTVIFWPMLIIETEGKRAGHENAFERMGRTKAKPPSLGKLKF